MNAPAQDRVRGDEKAIPSLYPLLVAGIAVVAVAGLLFLDTSARQLHDTDGYMRVLRLTGLLEDPGSWFDGFFSRSNAPWGHSMHWTRPMDAILAVVALPLVPVLGIDGAAYWAGVVTGPILLLAIGLAMSRLAAPVLGRWAPVAGFAAAVAPGVAVYAAAGRADHHALILLLVAVAFGAFLRLVHRPGTGGRDALVAGAVAALGVWTSAEFLLLLALIAVVGVVLWVVDGDVHVPAQRRLWVALTVGVAVALVLERGGDLLDRSLDRLSLVHLAVGAAGVLFWGIVSAASGGPEAGRARRGGIALVAGAAAAGLVWLVEPAFFSGPFGAVPDRLRTVWLDNVRELHPLVERGDGIDVVPGVVGALVIPVLGLVGAVLAGRRSDEPRRFWWVMAVAIALTGAVALVQVRWLPYPQMLGAVPLVWMGVPALRGASSLGAPLRVVALVVVASILAFGWRVPVWGLSHLVPREPTDEAAACSIPSLASFLDGLSGAHDVVLAAVDVGPELLFRSEVDVVAAPYHRNVAGILDSYDSLGSADESVLRLVVERRGVRFVAVCPGYDVRYFGDDPGSMFQRLVAGDPPPSLTPVASTEAGGFLVFETR